MKRNIMAGCILLCCMSCRKEFSSPRSVVDYQAYAKSFLQHNRVAGDRTVLDWDAVSVTDLPGTFFRVGFRQKDFARDFVLLKFRDDNSVEGGRIIHLVASEALDGSVAIFSLQGKLIVTAALEKGYLTGIKQAGLNGEAALLEEEGYLSPPLLVLSHAREGPSPVRPTQFMEYMNIQRAYNNLVEQTGSRSYYYSMTHPNQEYGGGATGYRPQPTILVDIEGGYQVAPLDLEKMITCFGSIPDQNATCSIELFTDIPVDADPWALFDWSTNSPGHTFIQLVKSGSGKKMIQNIGFYPQSSFKAAATTSPIPGKFVDNGNHEFNAAFKMNITPANLEKVLAKIRLTTKAARYDIDDYNCTDFALSIFNTLRPTDPVMPQRVLIPNANNRTGSQTPQMLYLELQRRMKYSAADRPFIRIATRKTTAGPSISPCK